MKAYLTEATDMGWLIILVIIILIIVAYGVRIVNQYERGVVFRLGKVRAEIKQPGLRLIIPVVDVMRKVSLRIVTLPIESQQIITRDNVSIGVSAVAYYKVQDPTKSIVEIENVVAATYQIAQTTVRNIVGQSALDDVLSQTAAINEKIKLILEESTRQWGIFVSTVELKDIQLPDSMQRAMAKQAEAEREKRAKIIAAEGEALSAQKLGEAADVIAAHPIALQLRNLQVLNDIAVEKNSTIIFPSQFMDTVQSVKDFMAKEQR
jgi:regulator of protease activity HflC (stomatin/prohibitin superfamily)